LDRLPLVGKNALAAHRITQWKRDERTNSGVWAVVSAPCRRAPRRI
jgi:hypothetical protein